MQVGLLKPSIHKSSNGELCTQQEIQNHETHHNVRIDLMKHIWETIRAFLHFYLNTLKKY